MLLKEICSILEELSPLAYAEDFDNVGLLVGNEKQEVTGVLVCHDALENVVDEAIDKKCNLIVCFHPILLSGIKKIIGKNYVERTVIKAIKNDIAIYAVHTALDNHQNGVNKIICDVLGLENTKVLIPKKKFIQKLVTYTPKSNVETLKNALFVAGAGSIGNYYNCSFVSQGMGSYKGNEHSKPVIGQKNELTETEEFKIEVIFEKHLQDQVLQALFTNHIYEEVAYEIYTLENIHQNIGLGMVGTLKKPVSEHDFLTFVKEKMQCGGIRHSKYLNKPIEKVAVLGGSGSFAINDVKKVGADIFITSDLKYHDYFQAENSLLLADIGHFESERYTKNYIYDFLCKKIHNFAIVLSETDTNPIKYF